MCAYFFFSLCFSCSVFPIVIKILRDEHFTSGTHHVTSLFVTIFVTLYLQQYDSDDAEGAEGVGDEPAAKKHKPSSSGGGGAGSASGAKSSGVSGGGGGGANRAARRASAAK